MSNIGYKKAKPKTKRRAIIAAASVALALLLLLAGLWRISGYKRFFRDSVEKWSRYYSVDEYLIYGMIYAESGGREQAQSSAELEYISALVLCGGQGASAGRERAAVCAHTQK